MVPFALAVGAALYWQAMTPLSLTTRFATLDREEPLSPLRRSSDAGCTLRGTVVSAADGEPVPGAVVSLSASGSADEAPVIAVTDLRGNWQLAAAAGPNQRLGIANAAFLPQLASASCPQPPLRTALAAGGASLRGDVRGPAADPLADVLILARAGQDEEPGWLGAFTDRHGVYRLRLAPGSYHMAAHRPGYGSEARRDVLIRGSGGRVDFWLGPSEPRHGRLLGDGDLTGVVLSARSAGRWGSSGMRRGHVRLRPDGTFVVEQLPPGPFEISARGKSHVAPATVIDSPATTAESGFVLSLQPARRIAGRVTTIVDGAPAGDALIVARAALTGEQFSARARSTRDGAFEIDGLPPGRFELVQQAEDGEAEHERVLGTVDVREHDRDDVALAIAASPARATPPATVGRAVTGVVVTPRGEPTGAGWLTATPVDPGQPRRVPLATDGSFVLDSLPATGRYSLTLSNEAGVRPWADGERAQTLDLSDGGALDELRAVPCTTNIGGKLVDETGKPLADATVWAVAIQTAAAGNDALENGTRFGTTMNDGRFVLPGLCQGGYRVFGRSRDGRHRGHVDTRAETVIGLRTFAVSELRGRVGTGSEPIGSLRVVLGGPSPRELSTHGGDGHFTVGELEPGAYEILIQAEHGYALGRLLLEPGKAHVEAWELSPYRALRGRLREAGGAPVADAQVALWYEPQVPPQPKGLGAPPRAARGTSALRSRQYRARTQRDGSFELRQVIGASGLLSFRDARGPLLVDGLRPEITLGPTAPDYVLPFRDLQELELDLGEVEVTR